MSEVGVRRQEHGALVMPGDPVRQRVGWEGLKKRAPSGLSTVEVPGQVGLKAALVGLNGRIGVGLRDGPRVALRVGREQRPQGGESLAWRSATPEATDDLADGTQDEAVGRGGVRAGEVTGTVDEHAPLGIDAIPLKRHADAHGDKGVDDQASQGGIREADGPLVLRGGSQLA